MSDDDVGPDLPPIADALREIEERAGLHDDDRAEHLDLDTLGQTYEAHVAEDEARGETVATDGGGLGAELRPADNEADEAGDGR
ncbi:hypothetical protein [Haloferax volcanii]|uniref:Uncharacterized protein n=1 Tax=Haloferax volcanii JCM 10717 TaxID=1227458 RepID=M0I9S9_HALVO|nr:hypothetical protein [Haloferax alexandrinus]ELZ93555.1 hypothetical protein C452_05023 [Haloferax alexandrinus JCM 10717]